MWMPSRLEDARKCTASPSRSGAARAGRKRAMAGSAGTPHVAARDRASALRVTASSYTRSTRSASFSAV